MHCKYVLISLIEIFLRRLLELRRVQRGGERVVSVCMVVCEWPCINKIPGFQLLKCDTEFYDEHLAAQPHLSKDQLIIN